MRSAFKLGNDRPRLGERDQGSHETGSAKHSLAPNLAPSLFAHAPCSMPPGRAVALWYGEAGVTSWSTAQGWERFRAVLISVQVHRS